MLAGCGATGSANPSGVASGGNQNVGQGGTDTADTNNTVSTGGQSVAVGGNAGSGGGLATGGASPTGGLAATGGKSCTPGTQINTSSSNYTMFAFSQLAPFYIFNNGWSTSANELTAAGTQQSITAYDLCTAGTISWKTDYNWSGANNTVKGYPAAILGWQSTKGWRVSSQTMLPKTISSLSSAKCSWAYTVSGGASQDVAYDIWVHSGTCTKDAITSSTVPSDEIMIWLYTNGGIVPIGNTSQPGLSISGATWDLWEGSVSSSGSSWKVHSFKRQGNSTTVNNLDIKAFIDKLNLGSKCLTSIQAGTEVFQGSGSVMTNSYTCDVQ
jgi:hypothetical protein